MIPIRHPLRHLARAALATLALAELVRSPVPVPATAIWSASDGLVNGHACRIAEERSIEVVSSHVGVQLNPDVMPKLRVHDIYANALRGGKGGENHQALAARLVAGTKLADPAVRKRLYEGGMAAVQASDESATARGSRGPAQEPSAPPSVPPTRPDQGGQQG